MNIAVEKQEFIDAIENIENEGPCKFQYGYITNTGKGHVVVKTINNLFIDIDCTTKDNLVVSSVIRTEEIEASFREFCASVDGHVFSYKELLKIFNE